MSSVAGRGFSAVPLSKKSYTTEQTDTRRRPKHIEIVEKLCQEICAMHKRGVEMWWHTKIFKP